MLSEQDALRHRLTLIPEERDRSPSVTDTGADWWEAAEFRQNWVNKLFYGDNLDILRERIPADSIDLIYRTSVQLATLVQRALRQQARHG
jgi:hypothetical protein